MRTDILLPPHKRVDRCFRRRMATARVGCYVWRAMDNTAMSWILCGVLLALVPTVASEYEVFLDTQELARASDLARDGWTLNNDDGWFFLDGIQVGIATPVVGVCSFLTTNPKNWVRMPYIRAPGVDTLYINISFTMRHCQKHPDEVKSCLTRFNVLTFDAERESSLPDYPNWSETVYTQREAVTGTILFANLTRQPGLNNVTVAIPKAKEAVYIAFLDEGTCATLHHVQVFSKSCPSITEHYVRLGSTPVGDREVQAEGVCVDNAVPATQGLDRACFSTMLWYQQSPPKCHCLPGFEGVGGHTCDACAIGFFKHKVGGERCQLCPANSRSDGTGHSVCRCLPNHFRAPGESDSANCTTIPSAPRNLQVTLSSPTALMLQWQPPANMGGRTDITYRVECKGCPDKTAYFPRKLGIVDTGVTIRDLEPDRTYNFTVYAESGVTASAGSISNGVWKEISESIFKQVQADKYTLSLKWASKEGASKYELRWGTTESADVHKNETTKPEFLIPNLQSSTTYWVKYRSFVDGKWEEFSKPEAHSTLPLTEEGDSTTWVIVAAVGAVLVCMTIVIIIVVMFLKRASQPEENDNLPSSLKSKILGFFNSTAADAEKPYGHGASIYQDGHMNTQLLSGISGKTYIDPHTYEDPHKAVREFAREIDGSKIIIEEVIGGGEFGNVCRGHLNIVGRHGPVTVAIKTLKTGASEKSRLDFLTEASIMGQFDDPNVIRLEGVVTKATPIMIVTEYMDNGSLDTFLRNNDGQLKVEQLVTMLRGISSGMTYLSRMNYIHRDLAARNILVDAALVCKVADFGLSRIVESDTSEGAYTTRGGKIPVRWTSPEAISFRKFTSASDVWSYGVVMWEVVSYGERPYWNWSNQEVIKAVDKDYRLPPPMDCPQVIYQLMMNCWQKDRSHRPKFAALVIALDQMLQSPAVLEIMAQPRNLRDEKEFLSPRHFTEVEDWLMAIGMECYTDRFQQHGWASVDRVMQLSQSDLHQMGIKAVGHQKRITDSINCSSSAGTSSHLMNVSSGAAVGSSSRPAPPSSLPLGPLSPGAISHGPTSPLALNSPFSHPTNEGFLV